VVFNATSNNISIVSWRSVLFGRETGVPGENHQPVASHGQTLSHNVVSSTPRLSGIRTPNVHGDRYINLNYHTITTAHKICGASKTKGLNRIVEIS
jgi:hypothetical protein